MHGSLSVLYPLTHLDLVTDPAEIPGLSQEHRELSHTVALHVLKGEPGE